MTEHIKPIKKGVYITGVCFDSGNVTNPRAGYWLDGSWNTLATPSGTLLSLSGFLFITGTDVYITGICSNKTVSQSGYWKNEEWHTLDIGDEFGNIKTVGGIAVAENGDVYISGTRGRGSAKNAGYWLNNTWYDLSVPSNSHRNRSLTNGICIEDNNIYIGGYYQDNESQKLNPCYWNNGNRKNLPIIGDNSYYVSMTVSDGNVYTLEESSGYFINDIWHELPKKGLFKDIAVLDNNVYVIGEDDNCGYWHNGKWNNLPTPENSSDTVLLSIDISGNDIYIMGVYSDNENYHSCYWCNGILHLLTEPASAVASQPGSAAVVR